jgi:hypothetical protein
MFWNEDEQHRSSGEDLTQKLIAILLVVIGAEFIACCELQRSCACGFCYQKEVKLIIASLNRDHYLKRGVKIHSL